MVLKSRREVLKSRRQPVRTLEVVPYGLLVHGLLVVAVALLALAGAPLRGAAEAPGVEVPLVQLDVRVTDSRGEPVLDLGREDFVLLQDDFPIPIAGFSAPSNGDSGPGDVSPGDGPPLHLVLYFHLQFLDAGDLEGLGERMGRFLLDDLPPDARVMLAVANPEPEILEGFTTDRQRILKRLDEIVRLEGSSRLESEYRAILREIREQARKPIQEGRGEIRQAVPRALLTRIGNVAEQAYRELELTAAALAKLIPRLTGLPGRKEIVVVSGRLPARTGPSLFEAWYREFNRDSSYWGDGRITGGVPGGIEFDSVPEGSTFFDTTRVLSGLADVAAAREVVLHTLDVSGKTRGRAERRDLGDRQALALLAEKTGGRDLAGSEAAEDLRALAQDLESRYVLAFAPPGGADGQTHPITVRIPERRRLKLRHSPVYRALSRDQRTAERLLSALILESDPGVSTPVGGAASLPDNPLEAEAEPVRPATDSSDSGLRRPGEEQEDTPDDPAGRGGPGSLRVAIRVPLANLALIPEGRVHRAQISIFSASAEPGELSPVAKAVVPVELDNQELLTVQGRRIEYLLELPPGSEDHRLAVAVRDDFQDLTSMLVLDLNPAGRSTEPEAEGPRAALQTGAPGGLTDGAGTGR